MKNRVLFLLTASLVASQVSTSAYSADERFWKEKPGAMTGLFEARDPAYVKECGSCHFAYSPGLLPQRSWKAMMERLDRHFGETLQMAPAAKAMVAKYLEDNAADVSPYEGSKVIMEKVTPTKTPMRLGDLAVFRVKHSTILAVMAVKPRIKVQSLSNCGACHQRAEEGDFGERSLLVPGMKTGQG
jgi:hypothetical protein